MGCRRTLSEHELIERVLAFQQHRGPVHGASDAAASDSGHNVKGSVWAQQQSTSPAEAAAGQQEGPGHAGGGAEWHPHQAHHQRLPADAANSTVMGGSMARPQLQPDVQAGPASAAAGTGTAAAAASGSKGKGPPAVHSATGAGTTPPRQQQAAPAGVHSAARPQLDVGRQGSSDETRGQGQSRDLAATALASRQAAGAPPSWQMGAGGGLPGAAGFAAAALEQGPPADAQSPAQGTAASHRGLPAAGSSSHSAAPSSGRQQLPVAAAEPARGLAPAAAEAGQVGPRMQGEPDGGSWSAGADAPASRIPGPSRQTHQREAVPSGGAHSGPAEDADAGGCAAGTR